MSYFIAIGRPSEASRNTGNTGTVCTNGYGYIFASLSDASRFADDMARRFADRGFVYAVYPGSPAHGNDRGPDWAMGPALYVAEACMWSAAELGWSPDGVAAPASLGDILSSALDRAALPLPEPVTIRPGASVTDGAAAVFEVRSGVLGTNRDDWSAVMEFDNGKAAGAWVGQNKAGYAANGKSLVIVKVERSASVVDWRAREAGRLADGSYMPLPADALALLAGAFPDHFLHLAKSDKRKLAFTETDSAGERDKQKVLTPAAYAERFFNGQGDNPYWYSDTRAAFVAAVLGSSVNVLLTPLGDVEAMVSCYRDTENTAAHGCMSYSTDHFSTSGRHPVEVYALGGDIQLAMLRGDEPKAEGRGPDADARLLDLWGPEGPSCRDSCCAGDVEQWEAAKARQAARLAAEAADVGDIASDAPAFLPSWDSHDYPVIARCLVWVEGGQFGRVYGESTDARLLRSGLEAMGLKSDDLHGAKLGKVALDCGGYLMPYMDIGGHCFGHDDSGDWFVVGGDFHASRTDGVAHCEPEHDSECERCNEGCDSEDTRTVYVGRRSPETWCEGCAEHAAFYCSHTEEYVSDHNHAEYIPTGCRYVEAVADWVIERGDIEVTMCADGVYREDAGTCDDCGDGFPSDDLSSFEGEDSVCSDCHSERQAVADAEALAEAEAEALAEASDADAGAADDLAVAA